MGGGVKRCPLSVFRGVPKPLPDLHGQRKTDNGQLFVPVRNPAPREIIRREFNRHPVAVENPNVVLAHLAGDIGQHLVPVLQLHSEGRGGAPCCDGAHYWRGAPRHYRPPVTAPTAVSPRAASRCAGRKLPGGRISRSGASRGGRDRARPRASGGGESAEWSGARRTGRTGVHGLGPRG